MPLILPGNVASATAATTYSIANSCRFDAASNDNLTRTFGTPTDNDNWTMSFWVKKCVVVNSNDTPISAGDSGTNFTNMYFASYYFNFADYQGSATGRLKTNRTFLDPAAWYNFVCVWDSDNGTAGDRMKLYVNGVEETSFSSDINPSSGLNSVYNSALAHQIGCDQDGSSDLDGYLAEIVFIDGQALAPTSFGEFDSDSPTIWKPIDPSGLTFGDNGFWLDFENSAALGNDVSGNDNDWTVNNLDATSQATDTPTNNFATLNPLTPNALTVSQGNLHVVGDSVDYRSLFSTLGVANGKWYVELKFLALEGGVPRGAIGMVDATDMTLMATNQVGYNITGTVGDSIGYAGAGTSDNIKKNSSNVADGTTWSVDDIICMAVDCDNGAVYFRENDDAWLNSGDPTSGASRTGGITFTVGETYVLGGTAYGSSTQWDFNYGNPPYANSSSVADADGYGAFEFAPPSGYFAMCTKNLAEYG